MLNTGSSIKPLWQKEKLATLEAIAAAKNEALLILAREREQIMKMSREEAIKHLLLDRNIDGRERKIKSVSDNGILAIS
jgi:type II restriction enzyme